MKILFVFTGGTIGSRVHPLNNIENNNPDGHFKAPEYGCGDRLTNDVRSGVILPDGNMKYEILKIYDDVYDIDFEYDISNPANELSENSNGNFIKKVVRAVTDGMSSGYDGVVVFHGTDTIAYTAAALGYALGNCDMPVCVVSSNQPLENSCANGMENLHAAICIIKNRYNDKNAVCGVLVPFRNSDGIVYVHRGTRLLESGEFDDELRSVGMLGYFCKKNAGNTEYQSGYDNKKSNMSQNELIYDSMTMRQGENALAYSYFTADDYTAYSSISEKKDEMPVLDVDSINDSPSDILVIKNHPGMDYDKILGPSDLSVRYIILRGYHSGTINTEANGIERLFSGEYSVFYSEKKSEPVYGSKYSLKTKSAHGVALTPAALYMKIWLLSQQKTAITSEYLNKSLAGDVMQIPKLL